MEALITGSHSSSKEGKHINSKPELLAHHTPSNNVSGKRSLITANNKR
jgi:hypothetical protein